MPKSVTYSPNQSPYDPGAWERNTPKYAHQIIDREEPAGYAFILDCIAQTYEPGMKVLEVGCAGGHDYRYLDQRKHIEPTDYTGLDITPSYLELAKQRFPGCRWVQGDARKLPFEDKEFDMTVNLLMLLHLDQEGARQALMEMCRVTKSKVFLFTYVSSRRYDARTTVGKANFLYNVMAKDELNVPGWTAGHLCPEDGHPRVVAHNGTLRYMPFDLNIFTEFMLERKE